MAADDARELYRRFILDLWQAEPGDLDRLAAEIVAPDFVIHRARAGTTYDDMRGPPAAVQLVKQGTDLFDDVQVTIEVGPVAESDLVAGRWQFQGSYRGGLPGAAAPPGRRVAFGGNDIVRIADGRIAEYWTSSDESHLMTQLRAS